MFHSWLERLLNPQSAFARSGLEGPAGVSWSAILVCGALDVELYRVTVTRRNVAGIEVPSSLVLCSLKRASSSA